MHALNYRFRSETELRRRLLKKGHSKGAVERVIDELRAEGWLDDQRFADEMVRSAGRRWGPRRLQRKLGELGVDRETIARAIDEVPDEEKNALLEAMIEKKLDEMERRNLDAESAKRRLASFLERRGFEASVIRDRIFSIDWAGRFGGNDPPDEPV